MWKCKAYGPYTINRVFGDGYVELKDSGDLKVFNVKGNSLKVLHQMTKSSKMVSLVFAKPWALELN